MNSVKLIGYKVIVKNKQKAPNAAPHIAMLHTHTPNNVIGIE